MVNPNVDELSMMTYLSQFLTAKLKPGAPLKPIGNPSYVKVSGLGIQSEGVNVTMPSVSFTVDTEGAGPGKVNVLCTGPTGPVKVNMVKSSEHTYSYSYVPSVKGTYTVEVYFSRRAVPGSPFKVQVGGGTATIPALKRTTSVRSTTSAPDFKITGPGLNGETLLAHQPLKLVVEARGVGPGQLACTAHVSGQQVQCTPIVAEIKDSIFSVDYTPTVAGSHIMTVTFDGKPIPKSPIHLKVIDPSKVHVSGAGLEGGIAAKWAEFTIDASAAGEGKPEVSISGPTTVQPTVLPSSDGIAKVKFLPAVPGKYTVNVLFANHIVPGSPFCSTFLKPDVGKVYLLSGPGLKQDGLVVKTTAKFSFDPKSTVNEKLSVIIAGPTGAAAASEKPTQSPHAVPTVSKNTNGTYNVSYKPQLVGVYKVHIYLNGQKLQESPIEVNVTDPTKVKLVGPGVQESSDGKSSPVIPVSDAIQWTVDCCSAGPGPLLATLQRDDKQTIDLQVDSVGNNIHTIRYKPELPGRYKLCLKLAGNAVPISPAIVLTDKEMSFDITKVTAYGAGVSAGGAQTGMSLPVFIDIRTAGKPAGHVTATLSRPHSEPSSLQFMLDQQQGVYVGEYMTQEVGYHTLNIFIDGKPIPHSPFSIPVCKPTAVKLSGAGLQRAVANVPNTITILTDGAGPGNVAVEFEGPSGTSNVEYTVKKTAEDNYELKYNPSESGNYFITISYGGYPVGKRLPIQCSTMESYVMEDIDFTKGNKGQSDISGPTKNKSQQYVSVGQVAEVRVTKLLGDKCKVNTNVQGPLDHKVSTKDNSDNTQTITLIPKAIGTYQIHAKQGQTALKGSPFLIKAVNQASVTLSGPGVTDSRHKADTVYLPFSGQLQWALDFATSGFTASDFSATVYGAEGYSKELEVKEEDAYHASVTFAPQKCGPYTIQVVAGGKEISSSPVNFSLQNAKRVIASGPGLARGRAGQPVTAVYDTTQAGEGPLSMEIEGPDNTTITCTSKEPGTFMSNFVPTKPGIYTLKVKLRNEEIPGSPFSISVSNPAEVAVYGNGVTGKGASVGRKAEVAIDTTEAGTAPVAATVTTPTGKDFALELVPERTLGHFHGEYVPLEAGHHKLHVLFDGEPIPKSPFDVTIPNEEECSVVEEPDLESTPLGFTELPQLLIDGPVVGDGGSLEAWVEAPNGKQLQCTISRQGDKHKVSFFPLTTGLHHVHVTREKIPTHGSPFPVDVAAQQVLSIKGPEVTQLAVGQPVKLQVSEGVDTKLELNVKVEGPSDCKVDTKLGANNAHTVELTPTVAGTYLVHVTHGQQPVRGSPFVIKAFNPSEVKLSGPGVVDKVEGDTEPQILPFSEQLVYTLDFTSAGLVASDFSATVYGAEGYSKELEVKEEDAYHASVAFVPQKCGPYTIQVVACGREIPRSPVNISLQDASKVTASGAGLTQGRVGKPVNVEFDATKAGEGSLSIEIAGPANVTPSCTSEEPGTFLVNFEPTRAGTYTLNARFNDKEIPGSPFSISVSNPAEVAVYGNGVTGKGASVGRKAEVAIDTTEAGTAPVAATVTTPTGKDFALELVPEKTLGHFHGEYVPLEPGHHKLHVVFDGEPIPKSPFDVTIPNEEECSVVEEPDLESTPLGFTELPQLLIDGPVVGDGGSLEAWVEAPNGKQLQCTISRQGDKHKVSFFPLTTGMHHVHVTRDKIPTHGSPFPVDVAAQQVLSIEGPEVTQLAVGQPVKLQVSEGVDTKLELNVKVEGPSDCKVDTKLGANNAHTVELTPTVAGTYLVHVTHGQQPVRGSPFVVKAFNPSEVKLSGPGVVDKVEGDTEPQILPFSEQLVYTLDFTSAGLVASDFSATVYGAEGYSKELEVKEEDAYHATVAFVPQKCGPYTIQVVACGREIPRSPVNISLQDASKVTASGAGLTQGRVGKPVNVEFDATKAGEGSLSIEIAGPANVTPSCTSEEPGTFLVNFEPTRAGTYTLHARFNDKEIPGSPFSISVSNTAEVAVYGNGVTGKGASVGRKAEVAIDTTEAGTAPVAATVTTPTGKDFALELVPEKTLGHFHGEYVPLEPGHHKLHVLFDGEPIPKSPFDVTIPNEEECSVVEEPDLESTPLGFTELPQLLIDGPVVGDGGSLEAWVEAPNGKQLQCTISRQGDKHKVSFFPLTTGMHHVHVTRDKIPTHGSPFPVDVAAQQVLSIEGPEVTQLAVGQPVKLQVSEGVDTKLELNVKVEGPSDCKVDTKLGANNAHTVELTPTVAGTYLVHVTHGQQPVRGSPFVVKAFNPSEVKLSGPGVVDKVEGDTEPQILPFSEQLVYTLDFTSAGLVASDFSATVYGAEGYSKELEVKEEDAYHASVAFVPQKCGPYTIQVVACGREIPRSPVNISLQDASKVTASGAGLTQGRVGKPVNVEFDATKAGEGSLSIEIAGPANVTPSCTSEEPGTFLVNFEPTRAGTYTLNARFNDKEIPGSPFSISVSNPAEVAVYGNGVTGKGASVGRKAEVAIDTTEAGTAPVAATVTTPTGKDFALELVPEKTLGHFHGEYVPLEPGHHKLHVLFDGEPIPKSPFDVTIPNEEECSVVEEPDLESTPLGFTELPQLLIDGPVVGDGGSLEAWVEAPNGKQLQCTISRQGDKHKVSFFPLTTGMHHVHVTRDKIPTHGSPFPVDVAAQQVLSIEGPEVTQLAVGQPVKLQVSEGVDTKLELNVKVEGPSDCKVDTKLGANNAHTVELTPTVAGTYLVHVTHGQQPVRGSPFVVKAFNPSEVKLSGPGVVDKVEGDTEPQILPFSEQLVYTLDFTSAGLVASDFSATVYGAEGYSKELEVKEEDAYHASVAFVPQKCGPYTIQVVACGREIPRSPVNISLQDASKVTASGAGLTQGRVGKPVNVEFDATKAGEGSLSIEIAGPANVTPSCTSEEPGTFLVNFEPTRAGTYTLNARFNDKEIPGSPFSISVSNPAEVAVYGNGVTGKGASVGRKAEVAIDTTEAGTGPVAATVTTPTGKDFALELVPEKTLGHFHGEYVPLEPGHHKLHVLFDGEPIPKSPFDVTIPNEEECSVVEEPDLESTPLGFTELPQLLIDGPVVGDGGSLEAWVEAPNGKQLQCTISRQGDKHKVSFFPLTTGMHHVHVTRDKIPTHGSPFPVDVAAQQVLSIEGPEVTQLAVGQPVKLQVSEGVDTKLELNVKVEGPSDCKVDTKLGANNAHTVELTPTVAGTYLVHVTHGQQPVRGSPFVVKAFNPSEVKLSGPGVVDKVEGDTEPQILPFSEQLVYTLDFTSAGLVTSDFSATVYGAEGYSKELEFKEEDAYHASVAFVPQKCGPYTIQVVACGREIPSSPVNISLQDASKVTASGAGLTQGRVGKPVTVEFDATKAGEGSLSIEIAGPANVTPSCTSEEPGTFLVNFEPTRAGTYTLNARFNDKEIPGSPFSISVSNPAEVAVYGNGVTGKGASVGRKAEVAIDTTEAGTAPVAATVTTPTGKDFALELVPEKTLGHFHGEYVPLEPGHHKLHVLFDGEPIPKSPFDVTIPNEEECSVVEEPDLESTPLGFTELPQLLIDGPVVGDGGSLEAWVEAPNGKQLQCTISRQGDKHKVSFFPLTTGMHHVHVTRDKIPTHGSPFPVDVAAQQVLSIEGPEVTQLAVGQPVKLQVSEGVDTKLELNVKVEGPSDCKVDTKLGANNAHTVELTPTVAGTYLVHVTHGQQPVRGSPFVIKAFNPSEVKLSGPGVVDKVEGDTEPQILPFSEQLVYTLDFTSAGLVASDFSATVYGAEGYSKELEVKEEDAYHASVAFVPQKCGPYTIQVIACGREIPRSPVKISLQDASKVTASGVGLTQGRVGKPVTVEFDATKAGEGSLSIEIAGPANVTPSCTSEEPGTFLVNFEPTRAGTYTLHARFNDKEIPGSPFSISVSNPAEVAVYGNGVTGKGASVGRKAEVAIDTTEAGTAPVAATVTTPTGKNFALELVPEKTLGHFHGEYVPLEAGHHKLHVLFDGEPIPKSPFDVTIPNEEECSVVEEPDLESTPLGFTELPQLLIDGPVVGDDGSLEAWVEAPNGKQLQCTISRQGDKHKVSFFPLTTGMHHVHVTRDKIPTHGSPFPVNVAAQHVLSIEGPEVTQLAVGQPVKLQVSEGVDTKLELNVKVEGPSDCKVDTKLGANNAHTVELTPTVAGTYLVHVTHGQQPVRGSPFVIKAFNPSEVKLSGPGVVDKVEGDTEPQILPFSEQLVYTLDFTSAGLVASDFSATVYGAEGYSKELEVKEEDAYHASVAFVPQKCGPYTIQVVACGREIPRSPVKISLQDASKVTASGVGLTQGRVGKPVTVEFDATKAGEGSLSIEIAGPANVTPSCTSEEPGTFLVNFEPTRAGTYTLHARFNDKEIPGSPFSISVSNPAEVAVYGNGVTGKGASVGRKAEVAIDTTEAGTAPVAATVTTPTGKNFALELVPEKTLGHFHGEYVPLEAGHHKLHVLFDGEPIPKSPFDVTIPNEEECSVVEEPDLESTPLGFTELPQLLIDGPVVGDGGSLEAWVEAPNGKQLQCTISRQGDKHKVFFFPLTTGMHHVHVTRDKIPTHGSPFPVDVAAQQVLSIEGPEVTQLAVGQPVKLQVSEGVDTKLELNVKVEGPSDCKVDTKLGANNAHTVELTPTVAGTYLVHVTLSQQPVRGSPFVVKAFNPLEVKLSGPGVVDKVEGDTEPQILPFSEQLVYTLDFTSAGLVASDFSATVYGAEGYSKELEVKEEDAYHASVAFVPQKCGPYTIQVVACGREIPRSPVKISLQDASKVTASGAGLTQGRVGKPVTVEFDATKAGEGSLSIEIAGPANVTPSCTSEEPGTFLVNFEPTRAGTYTLNARFNDKEIPGSPFSISVSNPAEVAVYGNGVTGKGASVGRKAEVAIDTTEAGTAPVAATVTTPTGKDFALELVPEKTLGHFHGEYVPLEPGHHKLHVLFDGEPIPKSPFDVTIPNEEECSVVEEPDLESTPLGFTELPQLLIDGPVVGDGGSLEAWVEAPNGKQLQCTISRQGDKHKVSFFPLTTGMHHVHVTRDKIPTHGSPFPVDVAAQQVLSIEGPEVTQLAVGQPVKLQVSEGVDTKLELNVKVEGPSDCKVDTKLGANNAHTVELTPTVAGTYLVHVTHGQQPVRGSPFLVKAFNPSEVKLSGPGVVDKVEGDTEPQILPFSEQLVYTLDFTSAGLVASDFSATVYGAEGYSKELEVKEEDAYHASVAFVPQKCGPYTIQVVACGREIPRSPVKISLQDASKVTASGVGLTQGRVGKPVTVEFDATKAGEGSLSIEIAGPANVTPSCTSEEPGTFLVNFEPTRAGTYTLHARFNDKEIPGSPFSISVSNPAEVAVYGNGVTGKGASVGRKAEVAIDTTEAGTAPVAATVTTPTGKNFALELVPEKTLGHFHGEYVPLEAGHHKLHVLFDGEPIPKSPFDVTIPNEEECSVVEEPDLESTPLGFTELPQLLIDGPVVGDGGSLEAWVEAPNGKQLQCTISRQGDKHKVSFFPLTTGMHHVHITRDKIPTHGSPFPVDVAAQQVLSIEGPEVTQLAVGQPVKLQVSEGVDTKLELNVKVEGPSDCKVDTKLGANNAHTVELTPTVAGTYLVHVTHGQQPVRGSPFLVKAFNPSEVKLSGPGVVDKVEGDTEPQILPFSEQLVYTLDFTSAGLVASDFSATVYGAEGYSKELEVKEEDAYHASVAFVPQKCGPYTIQVVACGREIPRSPVNISLQDASKVTASGAGLTQGRVGKPVTVEFDATKAGEGSLSIEIAGPANVTPSCTSEEPGTFLVNFEPTRAGTYTLNARFNDKEIPGSPFSISVSNPAEVAVYGNGVTGKGASVGRKAEVAIDTTEAGTAPVAATVTTPTGKNFALELVPEKTLGHFHGEYVPQEAGHHKLHVLFDGEPIPKSPFDVTIPNEEECSVVEEPDLESTPLGFTELPQLLIDGPVVGDGGSLEAWVEAPNGKQLQCTISRQGDKHKVSFFPLTTGMHHVHVTRDKIPTHGSPFPVDVAAQHVLSIEGPEVTQLAVGQPVKLQVSEGVDTKLELNVKVEGPSDCKVDTKLGANNAHTVELTPTVAGTYLVHVTHGQQPVHGSPFVVIAFNPSEIKLSGPGVVDKVEGDTEPQILPFSEQLVYTLDFTSAGLVASDFCATVYGAEGYSKELEVKEEDAYHASVAFVPQKCGPYTIQVVACGREIPRSPVKISLQDASKVTASGAGLTQGRVGKPVTVEFDATKAGEGSLSIEIAGPANVTPSCTSEEPGTFLVNFEPTRAGTYTLNARFNDKEIPGSPFSISVSNPAEVAVYGNGVTGKGASVGRKAEVAIDTTEAGTGPVAATVTTPTGKDFALELVPEKTLGHFHGEYVPLEPGHHKLHVLFDGEPIPKSPFDVTIPNEEECSVVEEPDLESTPLGFTELPQLLIDGPVVGDGGSLEAWVEAPNGKQLQCTISRQGDKHKVSFFPLTTGMHHVHVTRDKIPTHGSPFPVDVAAQQVLSIEGPEVTQLAVGQPVKLQVSEGVDTKLELNVKVEGPSDCKVDTKLGANNAHTVELTPTVAGTYLVHVTHGQQPVRGSPFVIKAFNPSEVKLSGPGVVDKVEGDTEPQILPFSEQLVCTLDFTSAGLVASDFSVTVYGAEGYSKELEVKEEDAYHASVAFVPQKCGPYTIQVVACGREIPRSPVKISLQDASKVTASGAGLTQGRVGKPVTVEFDATKAGEGSLSIEIAGPANVTPSCTSEEPGTFLVNFEPTRAGTYTLNAWFNDKEIPCSPFSISVSNPAEVAVYGNGVTGKGASVGRKAEVAIDTTEAGTAPVAATVTTPTGKDFALELVPEKTLGHFHGEYVPLEAGHHKLHVLFDGEPIPKSPFDVTIPNEEECSVVEEPDLESTPLGFTELPQLLIDGPVVGDGGSLEAWVEAPNGEQLQCTVSRHGDKHKVTFFPRTVGKHFVHIARDKVPAECSPFDVNVNLNQVFSFDGPRVAQLDVGRSVQIEVDSDVGGMGDLAVNVYGPGDCIVKSNRNSSSTFTIELTPMARGTYLVYATCNGKVVSCSDYVLVVGIMLYDQSIAHSTIIDGTEIVACTDIAGCSTEGSDGGSGCEFVVSGPGVDGGTLMGEVAFVIQALNIIEGNVNVDIHGPCDLDVRRIGDGRSSMHVHYLPTVAGVYVISITYAGRHIKGSPYQVFWARPPPDASKCSVSGIEKQGKFHIDCSKGGGCGYLEVAVFGAYVPAEDIAVKHNGDYTFEITYKISQPGKTTISVKWHGVHLSGSPFTVFTV